MSNRGIASASGMSEVDAHESIITAYGPALAEIFKHLIDTDSLSKDALARGLSLFMQGTAIVRADSSKANKMINSIYPSIISCVYRDCLLKDLQHKKRLYGDEHMFRYINRTFKALLKYINVEKIALNYFDLYRGNGDAVKLRLENTKKIYLDVLEGHHGVRAIVKKELFKALNMLRGNLDNTITLYVSENYIIETVNVYFDANKAILTQSANVQTGSYGQSTYNVSPSTYNTIFADFCEEYIAGASQYYAANSEKYYRLHSRDYLKFAADRVAKECEIASKLHINNINKLRMELANSLLLNRIDEYLNHPIYGLEASIKNNDHVNLEYLYSAVYNISMIYTGNVAPKMTPEEYINRTIVRKYITVIRDKFKAIMDAIIATQPSKDKIIAERKSAEYSAILSMWHSALRPIVEFLEECDKYIARDFPDIIRKATREAIIHMLTENYIQSVVRESLLQNPDFKVDVDAPFYACAGVETVVVLLCDAWIRVRESDINVIEILGRTLPVLEKPELFGEEYKLLLGMRLVGQNTMNPTSSDLDTERELIAHIVKIYRQADRETTAVRDLKRQIDDYSAATDPDLINRLNTGVQRYLKNHPALQGLSKTQYHVVCLSAMLCNSPNTRLLQECEGILYINEIGVIMNAIRDVYIHQHPMRKIKFDPYAMIMDLSLKYPKNKTYDVKVHAIQANIIMHISKFGYLTVGEYAQTYNIGSKLLHQMLFILSRKTPLLARYVLKEDENGQEIKQFIQYDPKLQDPINQIKDTDRFTANPNFESKVRKLKIMPRILQYMDAVKMMEDEAIIEMRQQNTIKVHAAIVRTMKSRRTMSHIDLFNTVVTLLKAPVYLSMPYFKKCIEEMITKEYIDRTEDGYTYRA